METIISRLALAAALCGLPLGIAAAQTTTKTTTKTTKPAPKLPATTPKTPTKTTTKTTAKPAAAPTPAAKPAKLATPTPPPAPATPTTRNGPFEEGTNALNLGIGLGSRYGYGAGFFGGSSSVSPAISLSYERGVMPLGPGVLGVGIFVGYQGASYDLSGGDEINYRDVIVTLRGAFHYPVTPDFDAYGGLGLGLRHGSASYEGPLFDDYNASSYNEFMAGLFVGGRYFFSEKIGAFAEIGYDQSYLKVGLTAKF
jgi:hypothetical protein